MKKKGISKASEGFGEGLARGVNWVFDVIVVSLLHLICCIPLVTLGGAKTSLYKMVIRWQHGEDATVPDYLKELKNEFRSGIVPGLITIVADVILYIDMTIGLAEGTPLLIRVFTFVIVLYVTALIEQVYMVNANFKVTVGQLLKNALIITLLHPVRSLFTGIEASVILVPVIRTQLAAWINKKTYLELRERFRETEDSGE
ncbi:MAG: YesL family protein [Eubacteriales bacterium]|nr:YesL family protein [Eubacteriales bacterium]